MASHVTPSPRTPIRTAGETMSLRTIDAREDYGLKFHTKTRQESDNLRTDDVQGARPKIKFYQTAATRAPWDPKELQPTKHDLTRNRPPASSLYTKDVEFAQPKKDPLWRRYDLTRGPPLNPLNPQYKLATSHEPAPEVPPYRQSTKPDGKLDEKKKIEILRQVPQELLSIPYATPNYFRRVHKPITEETVQDHLKQTQAVIPGSTPRKTPRSNRNPLTPKYTMGGPDPEILEQYVRGGIPVFESSSRKQMGESDLNPDGNLTSHCNVNIGNLHNGCDRPTDHPHAGPGSTISANINSSSVTPRSSAQLSPGGRTPQYVKSFSKPASSCVLSGMNYEDNPLVAETVWRQNKTGKWSEYERSVSMGSQQPHLESVVSREDYESRLNEGVESGADITPSRRDRERRSGNSNEEYYTSRGKRQAVLDTENRQWHAEVFSNHDRSQVNDTQSNSVSPRRSARVRALHLDDFVEGGGGNTTNFSTSRTPAPATKNPGNNSMNQDSIIASNRKNDPRCQPQDPPEKWTSRRFEETDGDVFQHLFLEDEERSRMEKQKHKEYIEKGPVFAHQQVDNVHSTSLRSNLLSIGHDPQPMKKDGRDLTEYNTNTLLTENSDSPFSGRNKGYGFDALGAYHSKQPRTHAIVGGKTIYDELEGRAKLTGRIPIGLSENSDKQHPVDLLQQQATAPPSSVGTYTSNRNINHVGAATEGGSINNSSRLQYEIGPIALNSPRKLFYERKGVNTVDNLLTKDIDGASPRVPKNALLERFRTHKRWEDVSDINRPVR
ncbi:unnamed protein product [Amoebophrya sp. A120]|nr:unnamed protein product [Amoebophrya sp. A120]|eukprot:GSA120T00017740001.1